MPTNDERREVAENLRIMTAYGCRYAEQFCELLEETVMDSVDFHSFDDLANRLADLIEPEQERTCHKVLMTWFFPATELTPQREVEYFGCSKCGEWLSDTDCYGLDDGPFYCSSCGCKVDSSFVTDEVTGEVIYRGGAKVEDHG